KVRISKMVQGVGEEALAVLEPGSYFGEMALIDDTPRSADATAHLACTLYVIQKADLEQLMFLHKDLAYELLWTFVRTLSARLREANAPRMSLRGCSREAFCGCAGCPRPSCSARSGCAPRRPRGCSRRWSSDGG